MAIELNPISSGYSTGLINENFQKIEESINTDLFWRAGLGTGQANQLEHDLDMNGYAILNPGFSDNPNSVVSRSYVDEADAALQGQISALGVGGNTYIYPTLQALKAAEEVFVGQKIRTLGTSSLGDGGGADYEIVSAGTGTSYGFLYEQLTASGHEAKLLSGNVAENKSVSIPTDFSEYQEAIDQLSKLSIAGGVEINLVGEAGWQPSQGVLVENGDYRNFTISHADAEVTLSPSFPNDDVFVHGINACLPKLACLVDANSLGRGGYWAVNNSQGIVADGAGVKNVGNAGTETPKGVGCFVLENSSVNGSGTDGGSGCIFTGAALRNLWVSKASNFQGENGVFDDCLGDHGVFISRESRAHLSLASVSNCAGNGLEMYRSYVTAPGAKFNGNGDTGANVDQGSRLSCPERGGIVTEFNNNGDGGIFARCSRVYAPRVLISGNTGMGVQGIQVSDIDLFNATVENSTTNNIRAEDGTRINIKDGDSTGSGVDDLSIARGSYITAENCSTTTSAGTPSIDDCNIGATFNTLAGNNGIIWD